jgi:DNA-binding PadR family transcriptional regulator
MTRFPQSGRRRDICVLLAGESMQAQALKTRLSDHYGERIEPESFYRALDALERRGFVESRTEGIHDVHALTDAGREQLDEHLSWMLAQVDHENGG